MVIGICFEPGTAVAKERSGGFIPEYYIIKTKDGRRMRLTNVTFERRGDQLVIRSSSGFESTHEFSNIKKITAVGGKKGSHFLEGMAYGALAGLVVGGLFAGASAARSCDNAGDPGDCRNLRTLSMILGPTALPVVGGLAGLGVGALLPKVRKVNILPSLKVRPHVSSRFPN